jgi:hypothetical protein
MAFRIPFVSASVALFFVVVLTLLGGAFFPDYSHLSQFISELGARQAPYEQLVRWIGFLPTGVLVLVFAFVAFKALPPRNSPSPTRLPPDRSSTPSKTAPCNRSSGKRKVQPR